MALTSLYDPGEDPLPLVTLSGPLADRYEAVYLERRARDSVRYRPRVEVLQAPESTPAARTTARDARETEADVSQAKRRYALEVARANAEIQPEPPRRRYRRSR